MAQLTGFKQDNEGAYIEKDPFSKLDYTLDWTNWMPSADTIASATVTATNTLGDSSSIAIDSTTTTDYKVTANISGGEGGQIYNIEYRITTTNGLKDSRNFRIKVIERQL
tara:strand:- start:323 stop:652 length:330 start_codon:yes stop_codon:yes gene_type:complete